MAALLQSLSRWRGGGERSKLVVSSELRLKLAATVHRPIGSGKPVWTGAKLLPLWSAYIQGCSTVVGQAGRQADDTWRQVEHSHMWLAKGEVVEYFSRRAASRRPGRAGCARW